MFARLLFPYVTLIITLPPIFCQSDGEGVFAKMYSHNDWVRDVTEVDNTGVDLYLVCESKINPTEWVLDEDAANFMLTRFPCLRTEWSYRWSLSEGYQNKTFLHLVCDNIDSALTMGCRVASNHSDNVLIKLEPNRTTGRLHLIKQRGAFMEYEEPEAGRSSEDCVRFTAAHVAGQLYWKCVGPNENHGSVLIYFCAHSPLCANTQRKIKLMPVCIDYLKNQTQLIGEGWRTMAMDKINQYPGFVAICELDSGRNRWGAALEFFFAGKDKSTIHFSFSEISMNDLIWFDPPPASTIYTKDKFETSCKISGYGLAEEPRLIVNVNGSRLQGADLEDYKAVPEDSTWIRKVSINPFDKDPDPGTYEITCSAMVWNTSEWASKTLKVEVLEVVPPSFRNDDENVIINERDVNVRLECNARGDPSPTVTWSHANVNGLLTNGRDLVFTTVAPWVNGSIISCTALNTFGQQATKMFKMNVIPEQVPKNNSFGSNSTWTIPAIVAILIIVLVLCLGLGYLYLRFVRFGRAVAQALSDEEVKDFQQGRPASVVDQNEDDQLIIECLPYNSEFEVAKENISIDFKMELGSGQYGVVYMGELKHGVDAAPTQVAVKTVRPNVPIEYFKALMSELKTLAYIGYQENIAKLVGAYSSNIRNRELYVGIEFCKTSLEKHLRKYSDKFTAETSFSEGGPGYDNLDNPFTMLDLIKWCGEIAAGMEYLSAMRVVHGDLAARNVLLSFDLHVKICDFGLARQLVDYTYIKTTKCNLPWKWMAIESLRQMHFSTMSDVWSYGVTCWEIFSLGEVPYPCMAWSWEFVNGLVAGNRLTKPKHASPEIFSMLLLCWFERQERRPLFSELKRFFQEQERQLATSGAYVNADELFTVDS